MAPVPAWLPADFVHPERVNLTGGRHLRPIRADDVDLDYPAVMGSRDRLYAIYGEAWGWPPATMTRQQDADDLAHHEAEIAAHESFNYALFDADETALLGCVYLDPLDDVMPPHDPLPAELPDHPDPTPAVAAEVSWWVVDALVGTPAEAELASTVRGWVRDAWPFTRVDFPFN